MMHINQVRTGAAFLARNMQANPREIVTQLIEQYPGATKDDLFGHFRDLIAEDANYQRAVDWYFFTNMHDYLVTSRNRDTSRSQQRHQAKVDKIKQDVIRKVLSLAFVMPNGKCLGECTGFEAAKVGGIFAQIGKKAGNRLVGKVFTDKQIQAIK
jgi:hypothetical protein